jgi:hypothetical protein
MNPVRRSVEMKALTKRAGANTFIQSEDVFLDGVRRLSDDERKKSNACVFTQALALRHGMLATSYCEHMRPRKSFASR